MQHAPTRILFLDMPFFLDRLLNQSIQQAGWGLHDPGKAQHAANGLDVTVAHTPDQT